MGTMRNFDAHKAVILERILRAWEKSPDMKLGELFRAAADFSGKELDGLSDEELCVIVERFTLLGTTQLSDIVPSSPEPITATRTISSDVLRELCYHGKAKTGPNACPTCKNVTEE